MATLFRVGNDYSTNKAPRIPVCICIDTSKENVPGDRIEDLNCFLEMVTEHINSNSELKAKVQLCVLSYGEETTLISDFSSVDNKHYTLSSSTGAPDLCKAINKYFELMNARIRLYKAESISHYLPQLVLLSSGKSSTDVTEIAKRLCLAQLSNKLCVLPFQIIDNDSDLLTKLTDDGVVYTEITNFERIFNCLKSGLELLSTSSASAGKSLKSHAITLNKVFKKG